MNNYGEVITIDSSKWIDANPNNNVYIARSNAAEMMRAEEVEASIIVISYNRLEKTKNCVQSIIDYTKDISYELILVDNGSNDAVLDYFKSINFDKKLIIRFTKNSRAQVLQEAHRYYRGQYYVLVANDIVVTENWLANIVKCYESDNKIGFAVPMSTNVSNLQSVDLSFKNIEELQLFAKQNNISDPSRWEERLRLVNPISVLKREIIDIVGLFDYGFFHDFAEDDLSIRIRRAGYKLIFCKDSFIHHDHDFRNMEDKNPEEYRKSLDIGRKNYKDKYNGLDAWDDVNNYEKNLISMLSLNVKTEETSKLLLGVDVRMGTPILEVKNKFKEKEMLDFSCCAFTTQAKYFTDLQTICGQNVCCDRIDYIFEHYSPETFDYIVLGEPINTYAQPVKLLQRLIEFAKPGGQILIKIKNINNISKLVQILGGDKFIDDSMLVNTEPEELIECAKLIGISSYSILPEIMNIEKDTDEALKKILQNANISKDIIDTTRKLEVENYLICLCK